MNHTVLTDRQICALMRGERPLIEGLPDEKTQVQPCGVDLTVRAVSTYDSRGAVDFDNSRRSLSARTPLDWVEGWLHLPAGAYHIVYNELVNLPDDVMALAYPRSSLLRCGVTLYTAVWDPGYSGRAEALLVVHNPLGFSLGKDGRVAQLVFTRLGDSVGNRYEGRFHGENI
ncbi:MAG: deoxyuridine 5'-triphosphate nucleotidohydrolase [Dehalococcoidia bacterium]|nr:deoxyuridine 5'-triphosphate nucleotidohydrolase [Dehalococcoidia bacterium]